LSAFAAAAPEQKPFVDYEVTPEVADGVLQDLALTMRLTGDVDGSTRIALPTSWSGADNLYRAVHDITAEGGKLKLDGKAGITITHAPGASIALHYKVRQDFQGPLSVEGGSPFRPTTQAKWFTAVGWTLFPQVQGRRDDPVSFHWGQAPAGWAMASDLDHATAPQDRRMGDILDSVLVGGEGLKVVEREAAGGTLRVAFHGQWNFNEADLAALQGRIAEASADFWREKAGQFFVAVTPIAAPDDATVQYGVGLGDAFSLWATPNVDQAGLRHILAHEYQHAWFPTRMGGVRSGPDEPLDYWLSEGFTDFYTLRILLRSGVWSLEDFVSDYNRILRNYSASPVRDAPNGLVAAQFWRDRSVADLPYQRGLLLAAVWDDRLRRSTHGREDLDDVVLAMKNGPDQHDGAVNNLRHAFRQLGGGDLQEDFVRYVDDGAHVLLPQDLFAGCANVRTYDLPDFERGFDPAATSARNGVVDGVDPRGPAYAAGLRNGMRILKREAGDNLDPRLDLVYRVEDQGVQKLIRYKPQGAKRVTHQEIALVPGLDAGQRKACARAMSGG
jgi:predicted metalloprotease with PDZ domain